MEKDNKELPSSMENLSKLTDLECEQILMQRLLAMKDKVIKLNDDWDRLVSEENIKNSVFLTGRRKEQGGK